MVKGSGMAALKRDVVVEYVTDDVSVRIVSSGHVDGVKVDVLKLGRPVVVYLGLDYLAVQDLLDELGMDRESTDYSWIGVEL